jgi:hypothetical protein
VVLAARRPAELDQVCIDLKEAGATSVETVAFDAADPPMGAENQRSAHPESPGTTVRA